MNLRPAARRDCVQGIARSDSMANANVDDAYLALTAMVEMIAGDLNNATRRVEWSNSANYGGEPHTILSTEDFPPAHFPAFTCALLHLVRQKSDFTYYGSTPSL
jgi:hypothetical protein